MDVIETEPESFNPYQFVYNNPFVYSDPTGMIASMGEFNASQVIQNILRNIQRRSVQETKDYVLNELGESATSIVTRGLDRFLPLELFDKPLVDSFKSKGSKWDIFELIVTDAICSMFNIPSFAWFGTRIDKNGRPIDNGKGCGVLDAENSLPLIPAGTSNNSADFLFSTIAPRELKLTPSLGKKGLLSGDLKFSVKTMYERYIDNRDRSGQWSVFRKHAKGFQWVPINYFFTWNPGPRGQSQEKRLIQESARRGVIMFITSLKQ